MALVSLIESTDEPWEALYSSQQPYRIEILRSLLENEGIISVVINKKDSAYVMMGEAELWVKRDDLLSAIQILKKFLMDE
jgi:hypothetical protein